MTSTTASRIRVAQGIATAGAAAEIVLVTAVTLVQRPDGAALYAGIVLALLKCAPLLALLPFLLRGSRKAAVWLCYAFCFYFPMAVLTVMEPAPLRWLGAGEIVVSAVVYTSALLAVRWGRPAAA